MKACVAYLTEKQNFAWLSRCRYTGRIAPKICQGQPTTVCRECSGFHPNRFTFGGVMAERVNAAKTRRKVNAVFGWSLASSRIMNTLNMRRMHTRTRSRVVRCVNKKSTWITATTGFSHLMNVLDSSFDWCQTRSPYISHGTSVPDARNWAIGRDVSSVISELLRTLRGHWSPEQRSHSRTF